MTSNQTWDYQGPYLEQFPVGARSTIANLFCYGVREGITDIDELRNYVRREVAARRDRGYSSNIAGVADAVIESLETDEAYWFADHIVWRESLPLEDRKRLKSATGGRFATAAMEQKAPSEKQLKYLRGLRCPVTPQTMAEASKLIEEYKR